MPTTHTLVIGAGQAGLAVSRCLTDAGVDHVVLERGRIAERWRSRAVGVPAPPHPQLGDPAARLDLPRSRARRLHDRGRGRRLPDRLRRAPSTRRCSSTAPSVRSDAPTAGFAVSTDDGDVARRATS